MSTVREGNTGQNYNIKIGNICFENIRISNKITQNYNMACCFVWMLNFVYQWAEGTQEQTAKEDVCA